MNKNLMKSVMALHGDTQKSIAELLNLSEQTISEKMNGLSDFKQSEIKLLIDRYKLTPDQVDDIFFGEPVG